MSHKGSSRGAAGMGTIRKKTIVKNGHEYIYWEGRFTTGYDPGTGKQIQKSISGKTQKEVAQKIKKLTMQVDAGTYKDPCKLTVAEYLEIWQREYLNSVKPNTANSYRAQCKNHIIPAIGAVKLSQLNPLMIQQLCNRLMNTHTNEPLSPKTVHNIHGTLHKALSRAVTLQYIPTNPADAVHLDLPLTDVFEIHPLEDDDVAKLIETTGNHKFRLIYLITLFTGLRQGEILGLSWDNINWNDHILMIRQQLSKNRETREYCIDTPKHRKVRSIVVADAVMDLLREQKEIQLQMKAAAGERWSNPWNLVFTREDGSCLRMVTVYKNYKKIVCRIDHGEQRFHDLRHSFASNSLENGDDVKTVQENLGHHSAAFTLKQYGHVKKTMAIASAQRMEIYIQSVMQNSADAP